jgi:hypothetical protein
MVLLLLPAVAVLAAGLVDAAFDVLGDESSWLPVVASFITFVVEDVWFSTEILPVVSVDALGFVMFFVERAPFCFEIEHVEVGVFFHLMD